MITVSMRRDYIFKAIMGHICMVFCMSGTLFSMDSPTQANLNSLLVAYILDPKASVDVIEGLIRSGADPELDCEIIETGGERRIVDLYRYALDIVSRSPAEPWEKQCVGNENCMKCLRGEILERKIQRLIEIEKEIHGPLPSDGKGIICVSRYWEHQT